MWGFLLSHKVVSVALPLLGVVAVVIGGLASPTIAYILLGIIVAWFICAIIYWWRNKRRTQSKLTVGGLIGRAKGGKVSRCFSTGKLTAHGKPEGVDVGGLIGQSENVEIVDSSADAEIEYKQDKE